MLTNATIYIADPSMMGSRFFDRIPDIKSFESISEGPTATGVRFRLPWGSVTMNFMPPGDLQEHLRRFSGYAQHIIADQDTLVYTLARIRNVRMSLGCVIDHEESDLKEVLSFLFNFSGNMNGLLFFEDSIFDFTWEPLGGPACEKQ